MLRYILISILLSYVLYKLGFFRSISSGSGQNNPGKRPSGGNVNVNERSEKPKKGSGFKGGDYIDYEDVK